MRYTYFMKITLIHQLNEYNGPHAVFAPMQDFDEAVKVVEALNKKATELAKAERGNGWEEYVKHYFAKEYVVMSSEDIISAMG